MRKAINMWTIKEEKGITKDVIDQLMRMLNKRINPYAHKGELVLFAEGSYILIGTDYTEREYNALMDEAKSSIKALFLLAGDNIKGLLKLYLLLIHTVRVKRGLLG